LLWCSNHERYSIIKDIWEAIDPYVEDNQYWVLRFYWWDYLEQESKKHAEMPTYIQALVEKAITWIRLGKDYCAEANVCFSEALEANKWSPEYRIATTQYMQLSEQVCGTASTKS
jgi:hypothetical protein